MQTKLQIWMTKGAKKIKIAGVLRLAEGTCLYKEHACLMVQSEIGTRATMQKIVILNELKKGITWSIVS